MSSHNSSILKFFSFLPTTTSIKNVATMADDLRRYRSMIRKMRERVFLKHPEKLDVFDEQYERERLKAQEEFPGAPDVGQYWAERRTWDWACKYHAMSLISC